MPPNHTAHRRCQPPRNPSSWQHASDFEVRSVSNRFLKSTCILSDSTSRSYRRGLCSFHVHWLKPVPRIQDNDVRARPSGYSEIFNRRDSEKHNTQLSVFRWKLAEQSARASMPFDRDLP